MISKEYLLDANIVIKIWNKYPRLFDNIEKAQGIDFKISQDIAGELSVKEYVELNGAFVLTSKFLKLLGHIISNDLCSFTEGCTSNKYIKHENDKNVYFVNGDKISINDYSLIDICKKYKNYTLVTEDKKMIKSAKLVLDSFRVLNFEDFINDLKNLNVL